MNESVVVFDKVSKSYPLYHQITGGIKTFLFNLPKALSTLRTVRREALRDVSFSVKRGEAFGVIGRNGAGKSTTLALTAGVIRPSSGSVIVKERVSPLLELGAGFHPDLTGKENIELNGVLLGLTRKEVLYRRDSIIDFAELHELIDQPTRTYSSGTTARLGFSVVVHLDPKLLLVDEVLAVGDLSFQKKCMDKMLSFRNKGVTIVIVSHEMANIGKLCDRVLWIHERSVRMDGPPDEVVKKYTDYFTPREDAVKNP